MKIEIDDEMRQAVRSQIPLMTGGSFSATDIDDIIEAVAPLIASQALERAASTGYVVCAETRHMKLGDKVSDAILALKDAE